MNYKQYLNCSVGFLMESYNAKPSVTFEQQRTLDFLKRTLTKSCSEKMNDGLSTKEKIKR